MAEKQNINVNIDHSNHAFFADGISLFNRSDKFFVDFRQTSPRIDVIGDKQHHTHAVKHSTIALDPMMGKALLELLKDSVSKYEKQFGKIKVPKKKILKEEPVEQVSVDKSYIG